MRSAYRTVLPALVAAALAAGSGALLAAPPASAAGPVVKGAILARYTALGGARSFLGQPLTDELSTPNGVGRYSVFQGGSIYWSGGTGAWEVSGAIRDGWGRLGYENSVAGFPTSAPAPLSRGGAFQRFAGSQVYTQPQAGTHEVHGDIFADWGGLDWEYGRLGYPTSDELRTPDRDGAFNTFERGAVYWSPTTGANEIEGQIRRKWASTGWENGALGFPTTDELDSTLPGGRGNGFESGVIEWTPEMGALVTTLFAYPSAVDREKNTITFDSVDQTFHYDDNDRYFRLSGPDSDASSVEITQQEFEDGLAVGPPLFLDEYLEDPAHHSTFFLVDVPKGDQATAKRQLLKTSAARLR